MQVHHSWTYLSLGDGLVEAGAGQCSCSRTPDADGLSYRVPTVAHHLGSDF